MTYEDELLKELKELKELMLEIKLLLKDSCCFYINSVRDINVYNSDK